MGTLDPLPRCRSIWKRLRVVCDEGARWPETTKTRDDPHRSGPSRARTRGIPEISAGLVLNKPGRDRLRNSIADAATLTNCGKTKFHGQVWWKDYVDTLAGVLATLGTRSEVVSSRSGNRRSSPWFW